MNGKALVLTIALLLTASDALIACEFKAGETKFLDYANCRYGADAVLVVNLPQSAAWESCIYQLQAFRPETLLAVTKTEGGKEVISINDRSNIGNPCYLTKQQCDAALKAFKANSG